MCIFISDNSSRFANMSDAKAYAQRNQRGSDWFSHDAGSASSPAHKPQPEPVVAVAAEPAKNGEAEQTGRTQMIKPKCDSNQWFKHDKKDEAAAAAAPVVEQTPAETQAAVPPPGQAAKDQREGAAYGKRDKMGSSASWFAHEHSGEAATGGGVQTARVTTKEGGDNATRMRGESENWFNYDASKDGGKEQLHVAKGRGSRVQNDEMHHIFHMNK